MKKLLVSLVVLALSASMFASEGSLVEKMSEKQTMNRISRYLNADYDQARDLKYIFSLAQKKYKKALNAGLSNVAAGEKALNFSLANSKAVLEKEQYSKLLVILNSTINNESQRNEELLASN